MFWLDEYPHELHANVLLLDNKIENWKVGNTKAEGGVWPFKAHWKRERLKMRIENNFHFIELGDYRVETKTWIVHNNKEHNDVFNTHAAEWFKQWEHADDYRLGKAY